MKKKDVTLYYGLIMAIYSIAYVTMSAFSSVYLLEIGLSNGNVGILLAVGSLLAVLFQPMTGTLIDRNPKVSTKGVLLLLGSLVVVAGLMIIVLPDQGILFRSVLYGICIMLLMLAQPFLNALGMDAINNGYPLDLGKGRSLGSLGYALGSYAFGWISVAVGPKSIPVAFSIAFFTVCVLLYFYPVEMREEKKELLEKQPKENPLLFFAKYKKFAMMLVGLVLIYFSHALINIFALQILTPKGGTSGNMGTASAIAAVCELVTAVFFTWYRKKCKMSSLLKVSGLFFTLKILFSYLVPNVTGYYLIQSFQMFGWGIMAVGIVYYVNDLVGEYDKAQGQAYAGMSYTIGSVLATFLGGNIIDAFGVSQMLLVGTSAAAMGTLLLWFTVETSQGVK